MKILDKTIKFMWLSKTRLKSNVKWLLVTELHYRVEGKLNSKLPSINLTILSDYYTLKFPRLNNIPMYPWPNTNMCPSTTHAMLRNLIPWMQFISPSFCLVRSSNLEFWMSEKLSKTSCSARRGRKNICSLNKRYFTWLKILVVVVRLRK